MRWHYGDAVVWHLDEDASVVYVADAHASEVVVLSGSAAVVWLALPGATTDEVVERIAAGMALSAPDIRRDVETFLGRLVMQGFLRQEAS